MTLLSVNNLKTRFETNDGLVHAVNGISFDIQAGQKLALVGESGSGKSQVAFSIMRLLAKNGYSTGEVNFNDQNLLEIPIAKMNKIRARDISIIFQDPLSSLNPYMKIGRQLTEILQLHEGIKGAAAKKRAIDMMDAVRIPEATKRFDSYPHEFSGGMRQRIVIAMALLLQPKLIIADEPTTALDVTVQAQIMTLLDDIQRDFGAAILLITHDLGVVAGFADEAMVMYGGRIMERGKVADIFAKPTHPYTKGLLEAVPDIHDTSGRLVAIPGRPPNLLQKLTQCPFAPRCPYAIDACRAALPELSTTAPVRACVRPVEEIK